MPKPRLSCMALTCSSCMCLATVFVSSSPWLNQSRHVLVWSTSHKAAIRDTRFLCRPSRTSCLMFGGSSTNFIFWTTFIWEEQKCCRRLPGGQRSLEVVDELPVVTVWRCSVWRLQDLLIRIERHQDLQQKHKEFSNTLLGWNIIFVLRFVF